VNCVQFYEYPYWGPSDSNAADDPNLRLKAYIAAARRRAEVHIMLDSYYDDPGDERSNAATCAYVNGIALSESLDLHCKRANPTGTGIHNKMVLVWVDGKGYVHTGSINGSENSSKNNREFAVQVQSDAAYGYLSGVFWHDWWAGMDYSAYLPLITYKVLPCLAAGEKECPPYDSGQRLPCCPGLRTIATEGETVPCDPPGEFDCDVDGCTDWPNYCTRCAPCGNGICEPEYGENRCTCLWDCEPWALGDVNLR
jgi:hypothetical protein